MSRKKSKKHWIIKQEFYLCAKHFLAIFNFDCIYPNLLCENPMKKSVYSLQQI